MSKFHTSVMMHEVLEHLQVKSGGHYIDCTLGGGGHTAAILKAGGDVLAIDCDQEAIDYVLETLGNPVNLRIVKQNFAHLNEIASTNSFTHVDGILFDLGVSSWQLTSAHRGFTFQADADLDMRMDQDLGVQARDLLAALGPKELKTIFARFGNEPKAGPVAEAIVAARRTHPITTTKQLADLVERVYHGHRDRLHPATKVFQALRIAINDELNNLSTALPAAIDLLTPGGRLVVISFHQGEDHIVKDIFKNQQDQGHIHILTPKPLTPGHDELFINHRARSAKLRVAQKI